MSNINIEKEYDNFNDWLEFSMRQIMKSMYVSLPAVISSYNPTTRRAVVQIAVKQVMTDGSETSYPLLSDVPVLFPSSSKYTIQIPLAKGDGVMLIFSQRGIGDFKQTYKEETPSAESFMSMHDAIAIVGFGDLSVAPAQSEALTIQTNDGSTYIAIKEDLITITAATITVNGNMTVNGGISATGDFTYTGGGSGNLTYPNMTASTSFTINGANFNTHTHSGVTTGGGNSGGVT